VQHCRCSQNIPGGLPRERSIILRDAVKAVIPSNGKAERVMKCHILESVGIFIAISS